MPLQKGKSNRIFEKNVKTEIEAGKPLKQSLAISYSMQKKNKKKKMAQGGQVPPSAKSEARPMPDSPGQSEVARNSGNKAPSQDSWISRPDIAQSQKPKKTQPIKHPRMVPINGASLRLRDEEDHLQSSASVNDGPQEQPPKHDNEEGSDRQGPDTDSLHMKRMAEGGSVRSGKTRHQNEKGVHSESFSYDKPGKSDSGVYIRSHGSADDKSKRLLREEHKDIIGQLRSMPDPKLKGLFEGGAVSQSESEEDHVEHPPGLESDNDMMSPDQDEYMAGHFAEGGEVERDHEDSIAAAIMAKRDRMHAAIDSGAMDMDEAVRMAEGGEINGEDSIYTHESADQADLSRNAEEDANMEDQSSFDALRKENYSESEGLAQLDSPEDSNRHGHEIDSDKHDMVDAIRRKMAVKRQFKVR